MECACSPECNTELERYMKGFVRSHTGESVELHLTSGVQIRHTRKKGHTMLAVLWAQVLQHKLNYPPDKHVYTQVSIYTLSINY